MKHFWNVAVCVIVTAIIAGGGIYYYQSKKLTNTKNELNTQISSLKNKSFDVSEVTAHKIYTDEIHKFAFSYPASEDLIINKSLMDAVQQDINVGKILDIAVFTKAAYGSNPTEYSQFGKEQFISDSDYKSGYTQKTLGANILYTFNNDTAQSMENPYFGTANLQGIIFGPSFTYWIYYTSQNKDAAETIIKTLELK